MSNPFLHTRKTFQQLLHQNRMVYLVVSTPMSLEDAFMRRLLFLVFLATISCATLHDSNAPIMKGADLNTNMVGDRKNSGNTKSSFSIRRVPRTRDIRMIYKRALGFTRPVPLRQDYYDFANDNLMKRSPLLSAAGPNIASYLKILYVCSF